MNLLQKSEDGKTLYCIAYENWRTRKTGFIYMHARNYADAVNQVLSSKMLGPMTRVVSIAPAIGVHYEETKDGNDVARIVYQ